ncbi:MAG: histidine kinase dimerization/phospho-acceptor domain-containing protein [Candidatus Acidiferrales bacterium]
MKVAAIRLAYTTGAAALAGVANHDLAQNLARELQRYGRSSEFTTVSTFEQLLERANPASTRAIFLDQQILKDIPLGEALRQLTVFAPVILAAAPQNCAESGRLVAEGLVEFITRTGDFIPLAAALIERRLRWTEKPDSDPGRFRAQIPADMAEFFRHEINNPLTGILGNAEMLLAHRERFSRPETQRLQTVVDLAVRLRETVRLLSKTCEEQLPPIKSA